MNPSCLDLAEAIFPEGRIGLMSFLKVYGDESYDKKRGKDSLFTCGAVFGWPTEFFYAGNAWDKVLKKHQVGYFRSYDCENLEGQFDQSNAIAFGLDQARMRAQSVRGELLDVFIDFLILGLSVCVVKKDFYDLIENNKKAKRLFGSDILIFSYEMLIKHVLALMDIDWPEERYRNLKVGFVFDEHGKWKEAETAYDQLKKKDALCARRMLVASHADDQECPGLQMADLIAYETRLDAKEWLSKSQSVRYPIERLKKSHHIYFIGVMEKDQLLAELDSRMGKVRNNEKGKRTKKRNPRKNARNNAR
jgi:Protein of unknown function (DUF3800)